MEMARVVREGIRSDHVEGRSVQDIENDRFILDQKLLAISIVVTVFVFHDEPPRQEPHDDRL